MNRTNRILPTYTGDVSGACSALFELGGMVVIHDPSGCNSTYNTHDETRWYDHDSLIFITGMLEREAVLGDDDKLVRDVVEAARELQPRFIALCNSPIPFINGTDFRAIAKLVERACGIATFYVQTNGMHDYVVGAGRAFVALAERFVEARAVRPGTLNVLGATPLDLGLAGSDASLRAWAREAGFETVACWAVGSTLDELACSAEAQVNLVVSATGLALARWMRERFGTPYVVGFPVGAFAGELADALCKAARTGECAWPCRDQRAAGVTGGWQAIGEPVAMGSVAAAVERASGHAVRVVCPLEADRELLAPADVASYGEEEAEAALAGAELVIGDPFYQWILGSATRLAPLPHQALSGRNGWSASRDLAGLDVLCHGDVSVDTPLFNQE